MIAVAAAPRATATATTGARWLVSRQLAMMKIVPPTDQ